MKLHWDKTYESLIYFKEVLEDYLSQSPQTPALRKMQTKLNNIWKEVTANVRDFDKYVSPVESVEILFPTKEERLINTWNFYKDYLQEQHGICMRSRYEKKSLQLLWEMAEKDPIKACEYLDYAMSKGYRSFFKVENKFEKPKDDEPNPFK